MEQQEQSLREQRDQPDLLVEDTVPVLVAVRDLAPGTRPGPDDVEVRRWPVGLAAASALTDVSQLIDRPLATALSAGDPLTPTRFVSRIRLPPRQVWELMRALEKELTAWETETGVKIPPPA